MNEGADSIASLGDGAFRYRPCEWGRLPADITLGDVGGVAVDSRDQVYVFQRGAHPMLVFDRDGNLLRTWGEGLFTRPHGIAMGPDDTVWCTDDGDHTVRQCTPQGRVLLELGVPGRPAAAMSGRPFNRCTHTALSPRGEIYVTDGYGNACVHKFAPDGRLLATWGRPGIGPGEFNVPHNVCCDGDGRVYVADRESHRIQVFEGDGRYLTEWRQLHRPCALCLQRGARPLFYVGEAGPGLPINRAVPNLGPRVSIVDADGGIVARLDAGGAGESIDRFIAPHGIAVDSRGDLYVGEVSRAAWPEAFPDRPAPPSIRSLRKLVRAPA